MKALLRILASTSRVIFVIVILLSLIFYALAISQICPPIDAVIIVFGPLMVGGIYWVWVRKKSTVAHKNFGLLFFYLFFSLSYVMNYYPSGLFSLNGTDFLYGTLFSFFIIPIFIFLAYFEEKARYHFEGKKELTSREKIFAYICAPILCLICMGFAGSIHYIANWPRGVPERFPEFGFLSYLFIIVIGFIASLIYTQMKKIGVFNLNR